MTSRFHAAFLAVILLSPRVMADVQATVQVRTAGGALVPQAYVALVPQWRPWNRPLAEKISKTGSSSFDVPAGTYHVMAAARGSATSTQDAVKIAGATTVTLTLQPLEAIDGVVRDAEQRPIAGARVSTIHAAIPAPLGTMSALAARHLGSDWSTSTNRRGQWRLHVPAGSVPLFFDAPGYAAAARVRAAGESAVDVSLRPGAALEITTDRVDPDLIVTLAGEGENPILEQERVWARWAETSVLSWRSLPPGTYAVYAKYPEPRYFQQTATQLATVTLTAGRAQALRLTLPAQKKLATATSALFLWRIPRNRLGKALQAFGRNAAGAARPLEHFAEEAVGGTVLHLDIDGAQPPFHAITEEQFLAPVHEAPSSSEPSLAVAHPRADAHFSVRFAEKELQPPTAGVAILTGCRNGPRVATLVAIDGTTGEFTAPAGCEHLVLDLQPFEPVVERRSLIAGEQSLGQYVLRAAGSADVRVVRDPGGTVAAGATVRALDAETPGGIVIRQAVTDERGWVHLEGLPPYWNLRLTAETTDGEKSPGLELRVQPRERATVDPLLVPKPASLLVDAEIDPAVRQHFPAAKIVTVSVRPADPERAAEARQENVDGTPARFTRLQPGRWLVTAVVGIAGAFAPLDIEEIELNAGDERRVDASVAPNIFEGVVTAKGAGIAARVMVTERDRTLNFTTAGNGAFRIVLQEKGTHPVAVSRLSAQGHIIPVGDVAFTDPARPIEIALPDSGTATVRVRQDERPMAGVPVWLSRRDGGGAIESISNRAVTADDAGEVRFEDLVPGRWTFTVRSTAQGQGAEKSVAIESGKDARVDLSLTSTSALQGVLRDLGGAPLPRARVDCIFVGPSGHADRAFAETDVEGGFSIELVPPLPAQAFCGIVGPMGSVDAFRAVPGQHVRLSVPSATAAVRMADRDLREELWLVAQDGRAISVATIASKIGRFGVPLEIPALAAGSWKIVRVTSAAERLALARGVGASLPGEIIQPGKGGSR